MWMLFKKMARNEAREKIMKNIFFYNHLKSSLTPSLPPSSSHFSLFFFGSLLMVCFHSNTSAQQQQPKWISGTGKTVAEDEKEK